MSFLGKVFALKIQITLSLMAICVPGGDCRLWWDFGVLLRQKIEDLGAQGQVSASVDNRRPFLSSF